MNKTAWAWMTAVAASSLLLFPADTTAQGNAPNPVGRVRASISKAKSPKYQSSTNLRTYNEKVGDWAQIDIRYETVSEWTDELKMTYYVWMETGNPREPNVLLKGEESFVHIERGMHQDAAFVHPNVVKRYGRVRGVAVEIQYQGRVVAAESDPKDFNYKRAAETLAAKDGLVVPKGKSPFAMVEPLSYELVKPDAPR